MPVYKTRNDGFSLSLEGLLTVITSPQIVGFTYSNDLVAIDCN
jgi:hypothetical protein